MIRVERIRSVKIWSIDKSGTDKLNVSRSTQGNDFTLRNRISDSTRRDTSTTSRIKGYSTVLTAPDSECSKILATRWSCNGKRYREICCQNRRELRNAN